MNMEDSFHLGIKALITNNKSEILLLRVNKDALKNFNDEPYWDIPGGRVQKGDSIGETLRREVKEETGIDDVKDFHHLGMVISKIRIPVGDGDVGLILSIYKCDVSDISKIDLSEEHVESRWFSPEEAAHLLEVKYPKEFIDKVKGNKQS